LEDIQTDPGFLRMDMYLTGKLDEDTVSNIAINNAGGEYDALTGLKSRTHFGRPNFPEFFKGVKSGIENGSLLPGKEASLETRVGVFYCK
jgi:NADPH oxidase